MNNQVYNPGMMKPPSMPQGSQAMTNSASLPPMSLPNGKVNGESSAPVQPLPREITPVARFPTAYPSHSANSTPSNMQHTTQNQQSRFGPPSQSQTLFQPQPVSSPYNAPRPLAQIANNNSEPSMNLLPAPFPNQYLTTTPSPVQSPGQSAPQSSKSSRNPSPLPNTSYDMLEGQFPSNTIRSSGSSNSLNENQVLSNAQGAVSNSMSPMPQYTGYGQPGILSQQLEPINSSPRPVMQMNSSPNVRQYRPQVSSSAGPYNNLSPNRFSSGSVPQNVYPNGPLENGPRSVGPNVMQNYNQPPNKNISAPPSSNYSSAASPNLIPQSLPNIPKSDSTVRRQYPQMPAHAQVQPVPPYSGQSHLPPQNSSMPPNLVQPNSGMHYSTPAGSALRHQPQENRMPIPTSNAFIQSQPQTSPAMYPRPSVTRQPQYGRNFAQPGPQPGSHPDHLAPQLGSMNLFSGSEAFNILQNKNVLPEAKIMDPQPPIQEPQINCKPEIFRCTLNSLPESQNLLQKVRLPLGILIHPFKDLTNLPVIQCSAIVRCRSCRTYINPFVYFVDQKKWKCNLCYKVNELPEEFLYDPVSKQYGDPSRRPEVRSATIEFIAPSEYMLRPPQPAVYLYLLDVTRSALSTGYLHIFCETLLADLDNIPGDARTQIGFITYDSSIHFYNLSEGLSQPQMMVVTDIDDIFIPSPDNILVNIHESKDLIRDLLRHLPTRFNENNETQNALGAALQAAYKLTAPTGGRITIMNTCLPSVGPGSLKSREDPNQRAAKDIQNLGPANDFYKKLSLDCSGQQIAVDLFVLSSQYTDVATLSCISKFSGGCIYHYPGFQAKGNPSECMRYKKDLQRYITRKIGFEAVMRIRCTRGISIHTFHGNFFVRSTDLLSLPNINPDAAFGMHMSLEESLSDCKTACFQAALLYTSSKGERRIRVHTLCLPITSSISDVVGNADHQAIACLVAKMAVDRSHTSSMSDAREALINVPLDALEAFKIISPTQMSGGLLVPMSLRMLPLYILAILKSVSFRVGTSTKLDERVFAMNQLKTLPLQYFIQSVYPDMYPVHALENYPTVKFEDMDVHQPPLLHLSSERTDRHGAYLLDAGKAMYLYVCSAISDSFCQNVLGVTHFAAIPEEMLHLPELGTVESNRLVSFIKYLNSSRPFYSTFRIIRDDSKLKFLFLQHIIEDRSESTYSYYEFLQHIQQQISK